MMVSPLYQADPNARSMVSSHQAVHRTDDHSCRFAKRTLAIPIGRMQTGFVLLIDAANVVGSRPNGWWRDRPGAARTLVERVRRGVVDGDLSRPVVVVLEGKAK